ncbi:hypothetical protein SAM40697_5825 [Streptomyces ambofaciens]|uniref:Uncharacterized protein n=1 Tax=Streptomyces ambofaciens TaxID=1889 RepID=A0ABN4PHB9_STRAM|nr:hypothetical protein SAM40697_5825 [Streptomyces ambofaciens]
MRPPQILTRFSGFFMESMATATGIRMENPENLAGNLHQLGWREGATMRHTSDKLSLSDVRKVEGSAP